MARNFKFGLVFLSFAAYLVNVNFKLTSACVITSVMALAPSLQALTPAATANQSSTSDGTADNSNPYAIIIDRNIFHLNPPPPPAPIDQKPVELPKVNLNGIVKIGDDVRVLFSIPAKDAKSQIAYYKLAPGEKDDVLELVRIHPDQQEVDVLVSGTPMTLSMLSNSLAATPGKAGHGAAPGPAVAPTAPPTPVTAASTTEGSSAIVVGGNRNSSSSGGGVTVGGGGGGGVTTIGGGYNPNVASSGRGVSVGGGSSGVTTIGGNSGSTSFGGGGVSVGGGGSIGSSGGSTFGGVAVGGGTPSPSVNTGAQLTAALSSGGSAQVNNIPNRTPVSISEQEANMAAANALPNGPPMPPQNTTADIKEAIAASRH